MDGLHLGGDLVKGGSLNQEVNFFSRITKKVIDILFLQKNYVKRPWPKYTSR